jgi:phosphoenolpyruvate carboxylase
MQSRHTLPGWYGLGYALETFVRGQGSGARDQKIQVQVAASDARPPTPDPLALLQDMYANWMFFRTMIDSAQMILGKADLQIAERYAELVPEPDLAAAIFGVVREEYDRTSRMICQVAQIDHLLDRSPVLQRSIARRNPYIDPMSYIQVELLRRLRADPEGADHGALEDAILLSISGIAAGLKNTG